VFLVAARAASAQPTNAGPEARRHFEEGTKAFNLGEFQRAVTEYKAAYNAKPDPVFLYNIAQAYRLGSDLANALFFYRSFLRNAPETPNRAEVERRIAALEKQIAEQKALATAPPNSAVAPGTQPPPSTPEAAVEPKPEPRPEPAAPPPPSPAPVIVVASAPPPTPVYKRWWLWTIVGVAVVGVGVGVGVGVAESGGGNTIPSTHFGNTQVTF
jgi:hypothetical protein